MTNRKGYGVSLSKRELQNIHEAIHQLESLFEEINKVTIPTNYDEALTVKQLAEKTSFHFTQILSWINRKSNPLPAYNPGVRQTRVIWSQFVQWIEQYPVQRRTERLIDIPRG